MIKKFVLASHLHKPEMAIKPVIFANLSQARRSLAMMEGNFGARDLQLKNGSLFNMVQVFCARTCTAKRNPCTAVLTAIRHNGMAAHGSVVWSRDWFIGCILLTNPINNQKRSGKNVDFPHLTFSVIRFEG